MGQAIDARSVDDVLINYDYRAEDKNFKPYYSVKCGGQMKFDNLTDDIPAGRDKLETMLRQYQSSGQSSIFSICYHRHLDKKGELCGTPHIFNVRLNDIPTYLPMPQQQQPINNEILTTLKTIEGRITALEEDDSEDEDEGGFLSGIYKDPEMKRALMHMLINGLGGLSKTSKTINGVPGQEPQNESDKIRTALKVIAQHTKTLGDDLLKLANIAENDPAQFNFLLSMLRK